MLKKISRHKSTSVLPIMGYNQTLSQHWRKCHLKFVSLGDLIEYFF